MNNKHRYLQFSLLFFLSWTTYIIFAINDINFTKERLSDASLSEGNSSSAFIVGNKESAGSHIFWHEVVPAGNTDQFYRRFPDGETINISDSINSNGDIHSRYSKTIVGDDGIPHRLWIEETGTAEGYDVFYWTPELGTVLLTDRTQSEGSPNIPAPRFRMDLDDLGKAHIFWNESDGSQVWFYWNAHAKETVEIINYGGVQYLEGIAYSFFTYESKIYLWDSENNENEIIYEMDDSIDGYPVILGAYPLENGQFDIYFTHNTFDNPSGNPMPCLSYVNSQAKVMETLLTAEIGCGFSISSFRRDDLGNHHAVLTFRDNDKVYLGYWNETLTEPIDIQPEGTFFTGRYGSSVSSDGEFQIAWISRNGSTLEDIYYWNSSMSGSAKNISATLLGDQIIPSSGRYSIHTSDSGIMHILWQEITDAYSPYSELIYWRSDWDTALSLDQEINVRFDAFPTYAVDHNDNLYLVYRGEDSQGQKGLHFWDGSEQVNTFLQDEDGLVTFKYYFDFTSTHKAHLTWRQDTNIFYWNSMDGTTHVTDEASELNFNVPVFLVNELDQVLITNYQANTANEGDDLFIFWSDVPEDILNETNKVYLPIIQK